MVLRQSPPGHKSRCLEDDVVLAVDNTTKNVIHYQKVQEQEEFEFPVVGSRPDKPCGQKTCLDVIMKTSPSETELIKPVLGMIAWSVQCS